MFDVGMAESVERCVKVQPPVFFDSFVDDVPTEATGNLLTKINSDAESSSPFDCQASSLTLGSDVESRPSPADCNCPLDPQGRRTSLTPFQTAFVQLISMFYSEEEMILNIDTNTVQKFLFLANYYAGTKAAKAQYSSFTEIIA